MNFFGKCSQTVKLQSRFSFQKQNVLIMLFLFYSNLDLVADKCLSFITEKSDVSWANSLQFEIKLSGESFMYISKKVVDPELNLEGHLLQYLPILNVDRLKLLFVSYHLKN